MLQYYQSWVPHFLFRFCSSIILYNFRLKFQLTFILLVWYPILCIVRHSADVETTRLECAKYAVKAFDGRNKYSNFNSTWEPDWTRPILGIPMIHHQTFKTEFVPLEYMPFVANCRQLNAEWQYILWRDRDNLAFIREHFPKYLSKYKSFKLDLQRADMIRYMVLYHYGGVYTDMDVECVRPFFPGLASSATSLALLDQERPEHANILYGREFTAMNSAMAAPPRHPFFLEVLRTIESVDEDVPSIGWSTGPELVTAVYKKWIKGPNGVRHPVKLLSPEVFSPMVDVVSHDFISICKTKQLGHLVKPWEVKWFKVGCRYVTAANWCHDVTSSNTIGRHKFLHLGYEWNQKLVEKLHHCNLRDVLTTVRHYQP